MNNNEPIIEELHPTIDEMITHSKKAYRHTVPEDKAVHMVHCDMCVYEGKVGRRHLYCPKCETELIHPSEVVDISVCRVKVNKKYRGM